MKVLSVQINVEFATVNHNSELKHCPYNGLW